MPEMTFSLKAHIFLGALTHSAIYQHFLLETRGEGANNGTRPHSVSQNHRRINGNGGIMVSRKQNEGAYNALAIYIYVRCACRKVHECRIGVDVPAVYSHLSCCLATGDRRAPTARRWPRAYGLPLSRTSLILTETGRIYMHNGWSKMHRIIYLILRFSKSEIELLKLA